MGRTATERASTGIVALLAGVALVYGVMLGFIGLPFFVEVTETGAEPHRIWQTSGVGIVFATGALAVLIGLARTNRWLVWGGAIGIAGYAGLGIFGAGSYMIPVGLLLILAVLAWEFIRR